MMTETKPQNVPDALAAEIDRCRDLLDVYRAIPTGAFGAKMIDMRIREGVKAAASGDVVQMIQALENLRSCE